jgi:hypothetical protein
MTKVAAFLLAAAAPGFALAQMGFAQPSLGNPAYVRPNVIIGVDLAGPYTIYTPDDSWRVPVLTSAGTTFDLSQPAAVATVNRLGPTQTALSNVLGGTSYLGKIRLGYLVNASTNIGPSVASTPNSFSNNSIFAARGDVIPPTYGGSQILPTTTPGLLRTFDTTAQTNFISWLGGLDNTKAPIVTSYYG